MTSLGSLHRANHQAQAGLGQGAHMGLDAPALGVEHHGGGQRRRAQGAPQGRGGVQPQLLQLQR